MTKLLPCPFCGGEAMEKVTGPLSNHKFKIVCSKCGCKTFDTVAYPSHIEAWNTRAERTCHMERDDVYPCEDDGCKRLSVPEWTCSECECENIGLKPHYCQNCGAKVIEE